MKPNLKPIPYILAAMFSISLILYPLISNVLYDQRQDGVVETYEEAVKALPEVDTSGEEALNVAREYNRRLAAGNVQLENPFESENYVLYADTVAELMDITGTGVIGVIDIPKLNVRLPIYYGTEGEHLEQGVGVLEYTSMPVGGEGTHSVLCAHSGLSSAKLFSDLPSMKEGDLFFLHVMGLDLAYQVNQIETVLPEDVSLISIDAEKDYCTLVTCVPYGVNTHRLLVRGSRISYSPEEMNQSITEIPKAPVQSSPWVQEYLFSIVVGIVVLSTGLLLWKIIAFRRKDRV